MIKYYAMVTIGALWAAASDSLLLLGLTFGVTILLMQMDKRTN